MTSIQIGRAWRCNPANGRLHDWIALFPHELCAGDADGAPQPAAKELQEEKLSPTHVMIILIIMALLYLVKQGKFESLSRLKAAPDSSRLVESTDRFTGRQTAKHQRPPK